jgi:endonuclease/exonuclease/phosphatase family metal-dependent hydrolase
MQNPSHRPQLDPAEITLYALLWLFFLQLLSEFVEAIYTFGLLGTDIPAEMIAVLLLLAPALLLLAPRQPGLLLPLAMAALVIFSRLALPLLDTRARLLVSGVGVAAFLIWLPAQLAILSRYRRTEAGVALAAGLALSLALLNLLRAWHHGIDPSLAKDYPYIGWVLGLVAVVLLATRRPQPPVLQPPPGDNRFGALALHAIGIVSVVALTYLAFAAPNVIARWVGLGYPLTAALVGLALASVLLVAAIRPALLVQLSRRALAVWNGLFMAALLLTILPQQLRFPIDPAAYPLPGRPDSSLLSALAACALLLLSPVLLINLARSSRAIIDAVPSRRALGGAFTIGGLWLLALILGHVFTTVYDYIPVVGPLWRDKFWLVYGLATAGMAAPLLASASRSRPGEVMRIPPGFVYAAALAAVLAVIGAMATSAQPVTLAREQPALRVATYNIQQGYRADGQRGHADQLALLRSLDADIIGLQESDTNRISGGNADLVRYFADQLDMHSYYGPSPAVGTFGVALLSRYPIENPRTFYMTSAGEQTAAIASEVTVGGQTYNIYVTHLGNNGPLIQQEQVLADIGDKQNVVLMGDFNFRPDSEQYALTTASLVDSWLRVWPSGADDQGNTYPRRIDHIFVSPGMAIRNARYLDSPASDHPLLVAEIGD